MFRDGSFSKDYQHGSKKNCNTSASFGASEKVFESLILSPIKSDNLKQLKLKQ